MTLDTDQNPCLQLVQSVLAVEHNHDCLPRLDLSAKQLLRDKVISAQPRGNVKHLNIRHVSILMCAFKEQVPWFAAIWWHMFKKLNICVNRLAQLLHVAHVTSPVEAVKISLKHQNSRPVCPVVVECTCTGAVTHTYYPAVVTFARPIVPEWISNRFRLLSAIFRLLGAFFRLL